MGGNSVDVSARLQQRLGGSGRAAGRRPVQCLPAIGARDSQRRTASQQQPQRRRLAGVCRPLQRSGRWRGACAVVRDADPGRIDVLAAAAAAAAWAPSTLLAPAAPLLLLLAILPAPALLSIASLLPLLLLLLPGYDVVKREAQALRLRHFGCSWLAAEALGVAAGPDGEAPSAVATQEPLAGHTGYATKICVVALT